MVVIEMVAKAKDDREVHKVREVVFVSSAEIIQDSDLKRMQLLHCIL